MGEKKGSLFNAIVVILITGVIISGFVVAFYPQVVDKITTNGIKFIDKGFSSAGLGFIKSFLSFPFK